MAQAGSQQIRWVVIGLALVLSGCFKDSNSIATGQATTPDAPTGSGTASNQQPTISGKPSTAIKSGEQYVFQPDAYDPDGDRLTFSVSGKPAWLAFDPTTGRLSGTPGEGDIGTYSGIELTVSDGQASANLTPFSIDVTQIALGSVTLSWTPPAENTDGSPLTNLGGYRIYFGKSQTTLDQVIAIDSPGITTYVIDNLSPSTYYFAMSSINTHGIESELSQTLSKTIS